MAVEEIHRNDIGTVFNITVKDGDEVVNLSGATTLNLIFKKPNGDIVTKAAVVITDGTDGGIKYTTVDGDLDVAGMWRMQGFIVLGSNSWSTDIISFKVYPNLT